MMKLNAVWLLLSFWSASTAAFHLVTPQVRSSSAIPTATTWRAAHSTALYSKTDPSRSGARQERLNRLAELEEDRVETDKSFVLKAAGGFVAAIVLAIALAAVSGVLY